MKQTINAWGRRDKKQALDEMKREGWLFKGERKRGDHYRLEFEKDKKGGLLGLIKRKRRWV